MCRKGQGKDSGYLAGHWLELKKRCKGGRNTGEKDLQKKREGGRLHFNAFLTGKKAASQGRAQIRGVNSMVTGS